MLNLSQPLVVAYGAGRDSTAMLIEMHKRGIRPDAILFANVGSEKALTYKFIPVFDAWLQSVGFPGITTVQYTPDRAPYRSMEGNCVKNGTLPGAAFQKGSCTDKFKIAPQRKWTQSWGPAQQAWAEGKKVLRFIGFECDETHRLKRADAKMHAGKGDKRDPIRYEVQYPLMDWGINLEKCIEIIDNAGLPVPPKSACYMCPNQKSWEVHELSDMDRAGIIMCELSASPYNQKMRGLWRKKSITEYILEQNLPFTPLTSLGKKVVLNPACKKFETGYSLNPPHTTPTLADKLRAAGHEVPEFVRDAGGETSLYQEDYRSVETVCGGCQPADIATETEQHLELVEAL